MKNTQIEVGNKQTFRHYSSYFYWIFCFLLICGKFSSAAYANETQASENPKVSYNDTKENLLQEKKRVISGFVKDRETRETLPGVTVLISIGEKHLTGTVTDAEGNFQFEIPEQADKLTVSMIGYKEESFPLDGKLEFKIFLSTAFEEIEEVVVTGIFNKAKESFTGAATFITKQELESFESRDILKTIGNIDPSFNIVLNDELGSDPNKLPEINIRGTSSLPSKSEQELNDLQDDERVNLNTPLFILDGFEISLERMMDLNQDEIQSITLLKDASATAIYGSRGANGVVVLTSVRPTAGKLKVSYRGSYNMEAPDLRSYNLLNAEQKLELERIAGLYTSEDFDKQISLTQSYSNKLHSIKEGTDTYWLSQPVQVGIGQTHNISLTGGDAAFTYSLNFQYKNITGAMKGSDRNTFNGSINISYLLKRFRFINSLSLGLNNSQNSLYGSFSQYASLNPYWRIHDSNGEVVKLLGEGDPMMSPAYNPLYDAGLGGYDKSRYTNIRENFQLEFEIRDGFKVKGGVGYTRNISGSDKFLPPNHSTFYGVSDPDLQGSYKYRYSERSTFNGSLTVDYAKVVGGHNFFVGLNGQMRESTSSSYGMDLTGFPHDRMDFISMGKYKGDSPLGMEQTTRSVGFTTNVNYSYKYRYFADFSYRLDGASSFGENSRFAPFYSIGLGWNVNRMKFFTEHLPMISSLRLKYSYGVTGSLQFSPYDAMTTYFYMTSEDRYDGNLPASVFRMGNPDLKWQTTFQHNLGMNLSLWESLVSMNANYYYKRTEDLITTVTLPLSNGYTTYTENLGDVLNQGVEVSATVAILRRRSRLKWNMTGAISHNRNKLLRLSEGMKHINKLNEHNNLGELTPNYLYREGESMNALYVVPSLGIDPATGKEMFLNQKGQPTDIYPLFNRLPHGLSQPKVNGRLSSNWTYKNFRVNMGFSFRLGANLYNSTLVSKVETTDLTRNVDARVLDERWRKPGDIASYKSLVIEEATQMSSRFVQEEATLTLNTLSLDYKLPIDWLKKYLNVTRASISYSTSDLLYFSTIKRERGTGFPYAQRHNLSLSIAF